MFITMTIEEAEKTGLVLTVFDETVADFTWNVTIKEHEGKAYVFLLNEATRYVIVSEFTKRGFTDKVQEVIWQSLKSVQSDANSVVNYLREAGKYTYGHCETFKLVHWTDDVVETAFKMIDNYPETGEELLNKVTQSLNIIPVDSGYDTEEAFIPYVKMQKMLRRYSPETLFRKKKRGPTNKSGDRMMAKRKNFDTKLPTLNRKSSPDVLEISAILVGSIANTYRTFLISANATVEELYKTLFEVYDYDKKLLNLVKDTAKRDKSIDLDASISDFFTETENVGFYLDSGKFWELELKLIRQFPSSPGIKSFLPFFLSMHGPSPVPGMRGMKDYNQYIFYKFNPFELYDDPLAMAFCMQMDRLLQKRKREVFNPLQKLDVPHKIQ